MRLSILIILAVFFVGSSVDGATGTNHVTKYAGFASLGGYMPASPKSLDDLPKDIREVVANHLRKRLGDTFYSRLTLSGGQIVNFAELYRVNPDARNYRWEIHAYDLHFEFKMPEIGIASYTAQITLRKDGSVIEDIDLPSFASYPEKLNFFPLETAILAVAARGFEIEKVRKEIAYDRARDILIWRFSQVVSDDGLVIRSKNIELSAHDGTVVGEYTSKSIR